jgi:chromosome segregation ATPase
MALSQDIKERIFAAANALHAASETGEFPSIEEVRQESRAGMNNVVEAMKEWRQNQRKQVQDVREPLPVEMLGKVQEMGQSLWKTAQGLANEALNAARVAFEIEKDDLIQLSKEQSEAFEAQTAELEAALARIADLERQTTDATEAAQAMAQELDETSRARRAAEQEAAMATQRAEEIERRAVELRAELDRAHIEADKAQKRQELAEAEAAKLNDRLAVVQGEAAKTQAELVAITVKAEAVEQAHSDQRKRTAEEVHRIAERMTKVETERDNARRETASAREDAAALRGELEATKTQIAGLLAALKPSPAPHLK